MKVLTALNQELLGARKTWPRRRVLVRIIQRQSQDPGLDSPSPDFDPSKKYPLVLEIHAALSPIMANRFDFEKQVLASKGYVVSLYKSPRKHYYGEDFAHLIHHAYPGDDFYDLNSGVDAVIAKGYIDTNNLFVTGGSGGGVLTCWTIENTERFRAAASLYPVINWYSFALTSDIPFITKYWFPGLPWTTPQLHCRLAHQSRCQSQDANASHDRRG